MPPKKKQKIERSAPHNIEAEKSLLGSLLIDKEAIIKIGDKILADDFYDDRNGYIYSAILDLYEKRSPIDILNLTNRLKEKKKLEDIGGRAYLANLASGVPSAAHVESYADITKSKSTSRRLISAASEIIEMGYEEEQEVQEILDKAEKKLFAVNQKFFKQKFIPLNEILMEAFERIEELHREKGKLRGIPTGFYDLDQKLAGLQKSDLLILAARPAMGKTSLALDIARYVAVAHKIPIGVFSLEMGKEQLVDRMLCAQAGVDFWKMRTGNLSTNETDEDFSKINEAMGILSEAQVFIDDSATANVMEIRTKARRLKAEHNLGLIAIDYLQLMEGRNSDNRVQEISDISRGLKSIARELEIPVLALSQLNRSVENRTPPIPKLADLRESGSIEQDADVVMFIYREDYYKQDSQRPNIAEIHIAKHRNGPTGVVELFFDGSKTTFKNLEKNSGDEPF